MNISDPASAISETCAKEWARVVATTVRFARNLELAEDCTQEAFAEALVRWPIEGLPERPGAWLTTVAIRKAQQVHRRNEILARKAPLLVVEQTDVAPSDPAQGTVFEPIPDDELRLVFICCHPALSSEARIALTLRLVCGLSSEEVAKAFLVSTSTMQARLTRAKRKIAQAGIPYQTPAASELPVRLTSVLDTIYLVFNAGHTAASGPRLQRKDLTSRSISVATMLYQLLPEHRQYSSALLALFLLIDGRAKGRTDEAGNAIDLEHQDRSLWNTQQINQGEALLNEAIALGSTSKYALMAAIALEHSRAPTWGATDWSRIVYLYDLLVAGLPSPVIALNRAVAISYARGPAEGLKELVTLKDEPTLATYPYHAAARADMLRRLGRRAEAIAGYHEAIMLTTNEAEVRHYRTRIKELSQP